MQDVVAEEEGKNTGKNKGKQDYLSMCFKSQNNLIIDCQLIIGS